MSFFDELKRRNVIRVGIAYAAVGWLLAQVADLAFGAFGAPDWALRAFLIALLVGFPIALVLAWILEWTPQGIRIDEDGEPDSGIGADRRLDRMIIVVMAVAITFLLVDRIYLSNIQNPVGERQSIAVLPFQNMSDDNDNFSDGLTEEILNVLAKNPDLRVAGRTSSFAFKGQSPNSQDIGAALNVDHYLEGSVRRSGDRLRVTAQLISVNDGFHIWSDTYDREMADIFDIQDDVATQISQQLNVRLGATVDRYTEDIEAYATYIEALAMTAGGYDARAVIEHLDFALARDPGFAKAHELKARVFWIGSGFIWEGEESRQLMYAAATAAIEQDPSLVGARAFAIIANPGTWSWTIQMNAVEEALRVTPDDINLLTTYCYNLRYTGYFEEAIRCSQRMTIIEPLWAWAYNDLGMAYSAANQLDRARESWARQAELGMSQGNGRIGFSFFVTGDYEAGLEYFALDDFSDDFWNPPELAEVVENVAGRGEEGKAYLDEWVSVKLGEAENFSHVNGIYTWYLAFGFIDDYFAAIRKASTGSNLSWSNAGILRNEGVIYRSTGYTAHPEYVEHGRGFGLTELWDSRGKPDMCDKIDGEWVCQ